IASCYPRLELPQGSTAPGRVPACRLHQRPLRLCACRAEYPKRQVTTAGTEGVLHVNRQVAFDEKGRMIVQEPKTMASKDAVPVIPALAEILQELRNSMKHSQGCWMFPADFVRGGEHTLRLKDAIGRTPVSPANFVRDQVEPILEKANIS